jgi:hypothetical protein
MALLDYWAQHQTAFFPTKEEAWPSTRRDSVAFVELHKIEDKGVTFRSHLDGAMVELSPEGISACAPLRN